MTKGKDEEKIRKSAESQNLPLPDWITNRPQLELGLEFYYMSFMELNTCRTSGMGEGPIPWTAMRKYAEVYDIYGVEFERFSTILTEMDVAYLEERSKKN